MYLVKGIELCLLQFLVGPAEEQRGLGLAWGQVDSTQEAIILTHLTTHTALLYINTYLQHTSDVVIT